MWRGNGPPPEKKKTCLGDWAKERTETCHTTHHVVYKLTPLACFSASCAHAPHGRHHHPSFVPTSGNPRPASEVPCAYPTHVFADTGALECVLLFSQSHEYPVPVVQRFALQLFLACVAFTAFNVMVLQRHFTGQESAEVMGVDVTSCSGWERKGQQRHRRP